MRVDDVLFQANRIAAANAVDEVVATFHDTRATALDARSCDMLSLRCQIMEERMAAVHTIEAQEVGTSMLQLCGRWPCLQVRRVVSEPIAPLSKATHATLGYLVLCMLGTRIFPALQGGGGGTTATPTDTDQLQVATNDSVVAHQAPSNTATRSPSDGVYQTLGRSGHIAATTANKYIETLRSIDKKIGVLRWPGGWLKALQIGRFKELTNEMHRIWTNPHTYRHKISCILSALVHCRDDLGMDSKQFSVTKEMVHDEYRSAKEAAYDKSLDNRLNKDRESRIVSDSQIDQAIDKATLELTRSMQRHDPYSMSIQMEKLWLLILRHVPAKRSDWGQCVILSHHPAKYNSERRDFNYILLPAIATEPVVLVLRDYKTKKAYGEHQEEMPLLVANEIRASLDAYPRDYLFVDVGACKDTESRDMKPFVKRSNYDRFARWVKRVSLKYFGVGATINDFRRRCVRDLADPAKHTRRERQRTAKSMLHSLQAQEFYRFVKPAAEEAPADEARKRHRKRNSQEEPKKEPKKTSL